MDRADVPVPAPRREHVEMKPSACMLEYEQTSGLMDSPPRPRCQSRRQRRRQLSNPLLDTISAIGDDDDEECVVAEKGDGYMGGSSVDSGYKSCCPTPEMVDIAYYSTTLTPPPAVDQQKRLSVASQASQASQSSTASLSGGLAAGQKPRIAMGTKVMSRQAVSAPALEPRRRHDSGFSDANLQPQTALRQILPMTEQQSRLPLPEDLHQQRAAAAAAPSDTEAALTGRRPRSSSVGSAVAGSPPSTRRRGSPGPPPRCRPPPRPAARHNSPHLPISVRRRRSPSPARPQQSPNSERTPTRRLAPTAAQRVAPPKPARAVQPANAASATVPATRATREEDIDALMYGPHVLGGSPAAAEYRGDFTGAANIRWPAPCASSLLPGQLRPTVEQLQLPAAAESARAASAKTAALKSRFSHMAQCMLDIIDELQVKGRAGGTRVGAPAAPTPPPPGSEYHTYEEVLYGALVERVREAAPSPEPPPLPLRPQQLFASARDVNIVPAPPTEQKPKQRNNFYSLFRSVGERRTLSHNLKQEISGGDGDEYGFAIRK